MQRPAAGTGEGEGLGTSSTAADAPRLTTILSYLTVHSFLHTCEELGELCIRPDHARIHQARFGLKCHAIRAGGVSLADLLALQSSARFRQPATRFGIMSLVKLAVTSIAPLFIISSPVTSYADQIWSMSKSRSSKGFSLDIPLIMLTASILKLFYWLGARYDLPLLVQASIMVVVQAMLLHVALLYRPPIGAQHSLGKPFADARHAHGYVTRPYNFWQWRSRRPYWQFLGYFTLALAALQVLLGSHDLYTQVQGYVALSIEAVLPTPQIIQNHRGRSCRGFRPSVLINWLVGDTFKMAYFYYSDGDVPLAFKLCALFQTACDIYLGVQFWMYGDGPAALAPDEKHARRRSK